MYTDTRNKKTLTDKSKQIAAILFRKLFIYCKKNKKQLLGISIIIFFLYLCYCIPIFLINFATLDNEKIFEHNHLDKDIKKILTDDDRKIDLSTFKIQMKQYYKHEQIDKVMNKKCTLITQEEIRHNYVLLENIHGDEDCSERIGTEYNGKTVVIGLDDILNVNEKLLFGLNEKYREDTQDENGSTFAMLPKFWNITDLDKEGNNYNTLMFLNPCVLSLINQNDRIFHFLNPIIVNNYLRNDIGKEKITIDAEMNEYDIFPSMEFSMELYKTLNIQYIDYPYAEPSSVDLKNDISIITQIAIEFLNGNNFIEHLIHSDFEKEYVIDAKKIKIDDYIPKNDNEKNENQHNDTNNNVYETEITKTIVDENMDKVEFMVKFKARDEL